jgi:serine/threonine protein kinase
MGNESSKKKKIIGTGEEFENDQIDNIPGRDRKRSVIHFNPNVIVSQIKSDPYKDYKVIKTIGEGTYGKVELVEHKITGMVRAMKVIKKTDPKTNDIVVYNELNILKQIDHQNVVKIYEYFIDAENYYLVTEYCGEGDLYNVMKNDFISEAQAACIMYQILLAVNHMHKMHIMHRDLKLDNILVNFKDENDKSVLNMYGAEVKIIDFGFAAHVDKKQDLHKSVLGSPMYMDPKLLKKYTRTSNIDITGYDESIDIWSLGNIFYEMLTGKLAFDTNDIKILEQKIDTGFYSLPTTSYKEVVGFLIGMFQYDSEKRLTAEELSKHDFLSKNIRHFVRIDINTVKNYIKNDKLVISIKEDKTLWNMFNNKYNKSLEMIPEDTEVSESVLNNIVNYKDKNNSKENEIKAKVKRAFDKMNEDFMYLPPFFIPLVPGNDPRDMYNEEKQI